MDSELEKRRDELAKKYCKPVSDDLERWRCESDYVTGFNAGVKEMEKQQENKEASWWVEQREEIKRLNDICTAQILEKAMLESKMEGRIQELERELRLAKAREAELVEQIKDYRNVLEFYKIGGLKTGSPAYDVLEKHASGEHKAAKDEG